METIEIPVDDEIVDFTEPNHVKRFRLDDDVFTLTRDLPTFALLQFADSIDAFVKGNAQERVAAMEQLFRLVLVPESADLFITRMSDPAKPIGIKTVQKVLPWLMEQYGLRPTSPSENSSDGSDNQDTGTNSTDDAPVMELT